MPRRGARATAATTTTRTATIPRTMGRRGKTATATFTVPANPRGPSAPGALRWLGLAQQFGQQYNVPPEIFLAAIQAESGGNPTATGDAGQSIGLFQLHSRGVGAGYSVEQRYDPNLQFGLMAPRIANAYQAAKGRGLSGEALAVETIALAERPAGYNVPGSASRNRYAQTYAQVLGFLTGETQGQNLPASFPMSPVSATPAVQGYNLGPSLSSAPKAGWSAPLQTPAIKSLVAKYAPALAGEAPESKETVTLAKIPALFPGGKPSDITVPKAGVKRLAWGIAGAGLVAFALLWMALRSGVVQRAAQVGLSAATGGRL